MDYVILSPTELTLAREAAVPTLQKTTDLLLRGGAVGYIDLEHLMYKGSEEDSNISIDRRRVNPVAFKSIMSRCGVMLTPPEYKLLRRAHSDEGGFLVDDVLEAVRPSAGLSPSEAAAVRSVIGDGLSPFALCDVRDAFSGGAARAEAAVVFTSARYPTGRVPPRNVADFLAAVLRNDAAGRAALLEELRGVRICAAETGERPHSPLHQHETSTCTRGERLFEYYTDRDNRDEWIKGREEADARSMYLRHLPGYQGHLPTYRSKFGRTFHAIEESLPVLSNPKPTLMPMPLDRYGPGVDLKDNRMSQHHFKLA